MGSFSSYAGWIIPPESEIIIIAETPSIAHHAFYVLRRMGFDENIYYYQDGVQEWVRSGNEVSMLNLIHPRELQRILEEDNIEVIDVRNAFEYQKGRIGNSINIPDHHIRYRHKKLDKEKRLVIHCSSGLRSSLASTILLRHGFKHLYNLAGGYTGYIESLKK